MRIGGTYARNPRSGKEQIKDQIFGGGFLRVSPNPSVFPPISSVFLCVPLWLILHPTKAHPQHVFFLLVNGIFLQYAGAATAVTQSQDGFINAQNHFGARF